MQTVTATLYSDILCIWAYVAEVRLREVKRRFGDQVKLEQRFCSVFGDTSRKIGIGWRDRGGYGGYSAHVHEAAEQFAGAKLHPDIWRTVRPASSASAHLFVTAARLQDPPDGDPDSLLVALRRAFFQDGLDIGRRDVQCQVTDAAGFDSIAIELCLRKGEPYARLSQDYDDAVAAGVQGSPTLVLNGGRQKLYGNVGFRIIEANIEELLRSPQTGDASWC